MTEETSVSCARPTGGLVGDEAPAEQKESALTTTHPHQGDRTMIQVGKKAPDFAAPAYHNGAFTSIKLSQYLGKWVALCFYPGDFTFV